MPRPDKPHLLRKWIHLTQILRKGVNRLLLLLQTDIRLHRNIQIPVNIIRRDQKRT